MFASRYFPGGYFAGRYFPGASTQESVAVAATQVNLAMLRGSDFVKSFTNPVGSGWSRVYFTMKRSTDDFDAASVIQLVATNPGDSGDGLVVINGSVCANLSHGSIVVSSESIDVEVNASKTLLVRPKDRGYFYDVKVIHGSSENVYYIGRVQVSSGVTFA